VAVPSPIPHSPIPHHPFPASLVRIADDVGFRRVFGGDPSALSSGRPAPLYRRACTSAYAGGRRRSSFARAGPRRGPPAATPPCPSRRNTRACTARRHAVVLPHRVPSRILVVVEVEVLPPVRRRAPFQHRHDRPSVQVRREPARPPPRRTSAPRRSPRRSPCFAASRPGVPRPAHHERRAQRLLVDPPLVEPAVLAEEHPLVRRIDDDRVPREARSSR
jgi:hypothetical protein